MFKPEIVVRRNGNEPPRKRSSAVVPEPEHDDDYGFDVDYCPLPYGGLLPCVFKDKYDYPFDIGLLGRLGLHCYNIQKGTNLKLIAINKNNTEMLGAVSLNYITLESMDTSNNFPYNFQTCVSLNMVSEEAFLMFLLSVPTGCAWATPVFLERAWKDNAVDAFYKGKMPSWITNDKLAAAGEKGQFYEQKADLQENDWLHLYAEFAKFAFNLKRIGSENRLKQFPPLEMKKVIIQTEKSGEELPRMKLKANNAIFYMSFKGNGDPMGIPIEYQAIVRRTMDGMPRHICLEIDRLTYKSN
ncbi:hypothetical protein EUTSA_v10027377mg [Eutrema salsugineum]|uniref:Uncharacterized protein n=1 Tax=Eutrema salsugineum TaxID=72664 RepID=V4LUM7_EUTSA|nr:hypothetical protein EUTSA_v10027377mg [Eutrema salsugineum]